ncbi:hypothetical protein AMTRI_Chr11g153630 [Amborella trichopoda]
MLLPRSQLVPCPLSFGLLTPLSHHRQPPSSSTITPPAATFFLNHHSTTYFLNQLMLPPSATSHQTTVSSATLQLATAYLPLPALRVSLPPISTINFYHHLLSSTISAATCSPYLIFFPQLIPPACNLPLFRPLPSQQPPPHPALYLCHPVRRLSLLSSRNSHLLQPSAFSLSKKPTKEIRILPFSFSFCFRPLFVIFRFVPSHSHYFV